MKSVLGSDTAVDPKAAAGGSRLSACLKVHSPSGKSEQCVSVAATWPCNYPNRITESKKGTADHHMGDRHKLEPLGQVDTYVPHWYSGDSSLLESEFTL